MTTPPALVIDVLHSISPMVKARRLSLESAAWRDDAGWNVRLPQNPEDKPEETRNTLLKVGLWTVQTQLLPGDYTAASWHQSPRPITGQAAELLQILARESIWHPDHGWVVPIEILQGLWASKEAANNNLGPTISHLKTSLGTSGAITTLKVKPSRSAAFYGLDSNIAKVDWTEARGALLTASTVQDQYQQAAARHRAEDCWVRSFHMTPVELRSTMEERVKRARFELSTGRPLDAESKALLRWVRKTVNARWSNRFKMLQLFADIGHSDRAVDTYRLFFEYAHADAIDYGRPLASSPSDRPRDMFFGEQVLKTTAPGRTLPALAALGEMIVNGKPLNAWLSRARSNYPRSGEIESTTLQDLTRQITSKSVVTNDHEQDANVIDIHPDQLQAITRSVIRQIIEYRPGDSERGHDTTAPLKIDVVVALGRHGMPLAVSICDILSIRLMGTLAMSRYIQSPGFSAGLTSAYIRGAELPLANPATVLICDDKVRTGYTADMAVRNIVRRQYPHAKIYLATYVANKFAITALEKSSGTQGVISRCFPGILVDVPNHSRLPELKFQWI